MLGLRAAFWILVLPGLAAGGGGGQTPGERCAASIGEGPSQPGAERIAWARDRKLTWTDFKARTPATAVEESGSCVGFDVSWECEDLKLVLDVKAVFDPAQSWVRADSADAVLLRHEQMHFDLTEVSARRLRKQFTLTKDPCKDPQVVRRVLDGMVIDMYREWGLTQKKYDEETRHGTEAGRQEAWEQDIRQILEELKDFEPER